MNVEGIKLFAVNITDLTTLNPIELLIVKDKIMGHWKVDVEKKRLDGYAVVLDPKLPKRQLLAVCQILNERSRVRTYYSTTGNAFYKLKFPKDKKREN